MYLYLHFYCTNNYFLQNVFDKTKMEHLLGQELKHNMNIFNRQQEQNILKNKVHKVQTNQAHWFPFKFSEKVFIFPFLLKNAIFSVKFHAFFSGRLLQRRQRPLAVNRWYYTNNMFSPQNNYNDPRAVQRGSAGRQLPIPGLRHPKNMKNLA